MQKIISRDKFISEELDDILSEEEKNLIQTTQGLDQKFYYINIDKEIEEPSKYRLIFDVLRTAREQDIVTIIVNTPGGRGDTLSQLLYYVDSCKAHTICELHQGYSAGAYFPFICDEVQLHHFSTMMFHEGSYVMYGKSNEHSDYAEYSKKEDERMLRKFCTGFLTVKEIEEIMKGKDLYLDSDEIQKRLDIMNSKKTPKKKGKVEK
jgi:ATP-dependent protease ClpP protease subunit